jgi:hypothetical protein
VNDGPTPGVDLAVQGTTTALAANWSGFDDPHTGITEYEWAIGTTPGGTEVRPFTSVATSTTASASGLALTDGVTYFVTVRATNGSGRTITATSNGIEVDGSDPLPGTVNDGATPGVDISTQGAANSLAANWSGFDDPHTGIVQYEWALGTTPAARRSAGSRRSRRAPPPPHRVSP